MSDLKYKCPKCGANEFEVSSRNLRPNDKMTCAKCGATDTYQHIVVEPSTKYLKDEVAKALKKAFR